MASETVTRNDLKAILNEVLSPFETRLGTATGIPSIQSKNTADVTFTLESAFTDTSDARGWLILPTAVTSIIPMVIKSINGTTAEVRVFNIANSATTAGATTTCLFVKLP